MPGPIVLLFAALFPLGVLWAALSDATTLTIPNRLTVLLAAAFVPAALVAGLAPAAWAAALAVGVGALFAGMAMFALGWVGGGDAKMFAACGLWLGASAAAPFLLWTALSGGVLAGGLVLARRGADLYPGFGPAWARRLLTHGEGAPYGVAIAVGALVAFPHSALMQTPALRAVAAPFIV